MGVRPVADFPGKVRAGAPSVSGGWSSVSGMTEGPSVRSGYRHEWALFTDWCAAADTSNLPASPTTLAAFLDENPAGTDAQRRRVAAINRVHRGAGHPEPGTVTAIRLQLNRSRADRVAARRRRVAPIIAGLPTVGWPTGLFGCRDAVVLALYAAGLRPTDISGLRRSDVTTVGGGLRIGGAHQLQVGDTDPDVRINGAAGPDASVEGGGVPIDFAAVWRNWDQVLQVVDRHPSTRVLEHHLRTGMFPDRTTSASGSGPVVVPIDRWGAVPLPLVSMTPAAIATVLSAHLAGTARRRRPLPARSFPGSASRMSAPLIESVHFDAGSSLSDTYAAGVAARRAAHATLADLPELFNNVEDRADELLRRTLALLDGL